MLKMRTVLVEFVTLILPSAASVSLRPQKKHTITPEDTLRRHLKEQRWNNLSLWRPGQGLGPQRSSGIMDDASGFMQSWHKKCPRFSSPSHFGVTH